ncbi:MAG: chemotaxis protein CheW [Planctomycetota bacterium]
MTERVPGSPSDRPGDRPSRVSREQLERSLRDIQRRLLELEHDPSQAALGELARRLADLGGASTSPLLAAVSDVVEIFARRISRASEREGRLATGETDLALEVIASLVDEVRETGTFDESLRERLADKVEHDEPLVIAKSEEEEVVPTEPEELPLDPGEWMDPDEGFLIELFREQFDETTREIEGALLSMERGGDMDQLVGSMKRWVHNIKGAAFQVGDDPAGRFLHSLEERLRLLEESGALAGHVGPLLRAIDAVAQHVREPGAETSSRLERLTGQLLNERWAESLEEHAPTVEVDVSSRSVRVQIEKLDDLLDVTGEIVQQQIRSESRLSEMRDLAEGFARVLRRHRKLREFLDVQRLKLSREVGDRLVSMEQSIRMALGDLHKRVSTFVNVSEIHTASARSLTSRLKDHVMSTRMMPIQTLFSMVPRVLRDVTRAQGKDVRLELAGQDTELDKLVIDGIRDPLLHLVRNAIDHGLETAEERERAGKPPRGVLRLSAHQHGGLVHLRIADDGRGIDLERVRRRAIETGQIDVTTARDLDDESVYDLLFSPGFSTREEASTISGRGIGLDVVRRAVIELNGQIEIQSELGRGTQFLIKLPLTLAIVRGLIVEAGAERFVIPSSAVGNLIQVEPERFSKLAGREVLELEGRSIPVDRLQHLVEAPRRTEPFESFDRLEHVLLLAHENRELALLVDRPLGEQWAVVKQLDELFGTAPLAAGATTLGTGEVVVVLDAGELVRASRHTPRAQAASESVGIAADSRAECPRPHRILVFAERSRDELRAALQPTGFDIQCVSDSSELLAAAKDPAIALAILEVEPGAQTPLVVISRLKHGKQTSAIPVLLVAADEDEHGSVRQLGLEVGADGFFARSAIGDEAFLRSIQRFTR